MKIEELKNPLLFVGNLFKDPDYPTGHDECIMCNRAIRGKNKFAIHACNGSHEEICSNDDNDYVEQNDSGDMGYWSVGSECVKKLRAELTEQGVNPDDYIYTTVKPKAAPKPKAKTKSWSMTEEDTLILWKALQVYRSEMHSAMGNPLATGNESDYERATMLLAKAIYKACDFAGTLDGQTVKSIYDDYMG
jgi:hypothetical protein